MIRVAGLIVVGAMSFLLASCETSAVTIEKTHVEVFIKGSDIETRENLATRSLRNLIESDIASRGNMALAEAGRGNFTILIPELVQINTSADPVLVSYRAHLVRKNDSKSRDVSGTCPEANLSLCASTILNELATLSN